MNAPSSQSFRKVGSDSTSIVTEQLDLPARLRITYIGHATLLLQFGSICVLTDPNFDKRLGVFLPRVQLPGVAITQLPPLSAILVTHAHADHLSFRSLRALPANIPVYAPPAIAQWLVRSGITEARSLSPDESIKLGGVIIIAGIAKHIGARYTLDYWHAAAQMYLLDDGLLSVLFTGDTALTPAAITLARRIHPRQLDVALLPIGHAPWWKRAFFRRGHLTAGDALELFVRLDARRLVPFHWGTFQHVTSGAFDAIRELRVLLTSFPRTSDVMVLEPGETLELPDRS